MAGMKNICGKIPLELHAKMRQEIEQREISTQQFIQQVIEEHFTEKGGQADMAVRTLAVQVSEELFARFKAAVAKKGYKQKDFLIALIERAVEGIEKEMQPEQEIETAETAEPETDGMEEADADESVEEAEGEDAEGLEEDSGIEKTESTGDSETEPEEPEAEDSGEIAESEEEEAEEPDNEAEEAETEADA